MKYFINLAKLKENEDVIKDIIVRYEFKTKRKHYYKTYNKMIGKLFDYNSYLSKKNLKLFTSRKNKKLFEDVGKLIDDLIKNDFLYFEEKYENLTNKFYDDFARIFNTVEDIVPTIESLAHKLKCADIIKRPYCLSISETINTFNRMIKWKYHSKSILVDFESNELTDLIFKSNELK